MERRCHRTYVPNSLSFLLGLVIPSIVFVTYYTSHHDADYGTHIYVETEGRDPYRSNRKQLDSPSESLGNHKESPCTLDMLRDLMLHYGYFPNHTWWRNDSFAHKPLFSDDCRVPQGNTDMTGCFVKRGIRKIGVTGDSNGNRMRLHMMYKLGGKGKRNCSRVRAEGGVNQVNRSYLLREGEQVIVSHPRDCSGCGGKVDVCYSGRHRFEIDFEGSEFLLDSEVTTHRLRYNKSESPCKLPHDSNFSWPCPQSLTTQQFLLKEYFPRTGYPDLLLMFAGSHDTKTQTVAETELYARLLGGMIALYVPPTTTVIFFSKPYEDVWRKPKKWWTKFEGRDTHAQVRLMNEAIGRGLIDSGVFTTRGKGVFPFFDMWHLGAPLTREWARDGVHKKRPWYEQILMYTTNILCQTS